MWQRLCYSDASVQGWCALRRTKARQVAWRGSKETTSYSQAPQRWAFTTMAGTSNVSRRFKAWGNLAGVGAQEPAVPSLKWHEPWKKPQVGGSAVSADGITWTDYRRLQDFNDTQRNAWRFDAQASMFYDPRLDEYVGTMRAFRPCSSCGLCPIWWQPSTTGPATGCLAHLNSKTCTATQCNRTVRAIGLSTSSSGDFRPPPGRGTRRFRLTIPTHFTNFILRSRFHTMTFISAS